MLVIRYSTLRSWEIYNMIGKYTLILNSSLGNNCNIYDKVILRKCKLGNNILIGDDSFISDTQIQENTRVERRSMIFNSAIGRFNMISFNAVVRDSQFNDYFNLGNNSNVLRATVGKYTSISYNCSIGGPNHEYHNITNHAFYNFSSYGYIDNDITMKSYSDPLIIGNDVWIASNVVITRGCSIGDGAVLGGGAVCTHNVPPYEIWAGNPARKIGQRFSDEMISDLLDLRWWDFPSEVIKNNLHLFNSMLTTDKLETIKMIKKRLNNGSF